ncbi:uncharacterized protein EAF01_010134 [Botrytis porri]|uniref:uncharacterized protein n=1 Tax=Botrytis porri TaxID=87229 RepID=UPI0019007D36|nr:uncharacterized protein EAF01_010134 [Botrytis porri]KAF7894684.1 hypothetical protein EAF01_010134 [Botrytis porri]
MDNDTIERRVYLSSESHFALFKHDLDIHKSYKEQIKTAHERIQYLESEFRGQESRLRDHDSLHKRLYESEKIRTLETSARIRLQRHLRVEQTNSSELSERAKTLQEQLVKMEGEFTSLQARFLDATFAIATCNQMLQNETNELQHQVMYDKEEILHNQRIIRSLATKIALYDSDAERDINFL